MRMPRRGAVAAGAHNAGGMAFRLTLPHKGFLGHSAISGALHSPVEKFERRGVDEHDVELAADQFERLCVWSFAA